jgi:thioredoxin 1
MGAISNVNESDFNSILASSEVPVLVDFWATWCGPCKAIAPTLEKMANDYGGLLKIVKVDVDQNRALAMKYGVRSIPFLAVFRGGQLVQSHVGATNRDTLDKLVKAAQA